MRLLLAHPWIFLVFLYLAVFFISGVVGTRSLSWRIKSAGSEMIFRKPFTRRLALILAALPLAFFPLFMYLTTRAHQTVGGDNPELLVLYALLTDGVAALLLWLGQPEEMRFDPPRHAYSYRKGWPLLAKFRSGTFSDLTGLFIKAIPGQGGTQYFCYLRWKQPERMVTCLGIFYREGDAQELVKNTGELLGLPVLGEVKSW